MMDGAFCQKCRTWLADENATFCDPCAALELEARYGDALRPDALQATVAAVSERMDEILSLFKPGVKIAVLVRTPEHPTRDFMLTSDTIPELRAMLDRRESPWQPIETAPKDGTRVLLSMRECGNKGPNTEVVIGSYVVWSEQMRRQGMRDGWSWYGAAFMEPAGWAPLPEAHPPQSAGAP